MKGEKHLRSFDHVSIKIFSELMAFYMQRGASELDMELNDLEDRVTIHISSLVENLCQEEIDEAVSQLSVNRQHEVESYYWQLSGEDDDNDFMTVGMMIDDAEVTYEDGRLTIDVTRLK